MVGIPDEYKAGYKFFLDQKIDLSKYPLIPREETEYWVLEAIKEINKKKKAFCLDLFAGSGCIGIAVLKNTSAFCDFGEINDNFLEQIKINIDLNGISSDRYNVFKTDIFSEINKKYDYILANPPYVAEKRINEVGKDVLAFEPKIALFSGEDGMEIIKKFLYEAKNYLNDNGVIFLEFDSEQEKQIDYILKKEKYSSWNFFCDQFKLVRFVRAVL
ncbi:MAG: class I SAM-dependent methyltransferase [Candidatus Pacebacteria bacterium]|nr:class I SAM-dependent methyltransferase [Candidatus Paceibacterota bacterium]